MGRLAPGEQYPGSQHVMTPQKRKVKAVEVKPVKILEPCARCGHSAIDGAAIQEAKWEIVLSDGSSLFLCGHHKHAFRFHILRQGYEVKEHA